MTLVLTLQHCVVSNHCSAKDIVWVSLHVECVCVKAYFYLHLFDFLFDYNVHRVI